MFCSKRMSAAILTTRLNMVFSFRHFVKNVLGVTPMEYLTGNIELVNNNWMILLFASIVLLYFDRARLTKFYVCCFVQSWTIWWKVSVCFVIWCELHLLGACGWCRYEDDPIIGHRLYREIRKVEVKKAKAKGSQVLPSTTYQWEAVATNFDEFQDVSVSCYKWFFPLYVSSLSLSL